MKQFLVLGFVAFLGMACVGNAQPKLEIVGGDTYDWGRVKPTDSPLQTTIVFKNIGTENLKITEVRAGCGCTTTKESKSEIKPGDTASVKVSLSVASNTGGVHKFITITSNDPQKPTVMYNLKAEVYRPISVKPTTYFTFPQMTVGTASTAKLSIGNSSDKDITLSVLEVPDGMKLNLGKNTVVKAGTDTELALSVVPSKAGYVSGNVKIKTSHPDFPTIDIPVHGNAVKSTSPVYLNSDTK